MQTKYRLFRRVNGIYFAQETDGPGQKSLRTKDRSEAKTQLNAKNEAERQPRLNLALARVYLSGHDRETATRTWQRVMDHMAANGLDSTRERCARALQSRAYDGLRNQVMVETTAEELLKIVQANGNSVHHYLRRLHNLALNLGWIAWPIVPKALWPKVASKRRRAITEEEHLRIIAREKNAERRLFYQMLYETGTAQTDGANLCAEDFDQRTGVLSYRRKNLGPDSQPAHLSVGPKLRELLKILPAVGPLFPKIALESAKHRAAEFRRRCLILKIKGVSLHSYRHSWAERAKSCGYPQRFAQVALGHSSRAVHEAYAKAAVVICPSLEDFQNRSQQPTVNDEAFTTIPFRLPPQEGQR